MQLSANRECLLTADYLHARRIRDFRSRSPASNLSLCSARAAWATRFRRIIRAICVRTNPRGCGGGNLWPSERESPPGLRRASGVNGGDTKDTCRFTLSIARAVSEATSASTESTSAAFALISRLISRRELSSAKAKRPRSFVRIKFRGTSRRWRGGEIINDPPRV